MRNKKLLGTIISIIVIILALIKPVYNTVTDKFSTTEPTLDYTITGYSENTTEETTEESSQITTTRKQTTTKSATVTTSKKTTTEKKTGSKPDINGSYFSKDEVALYIHTYGRLPNNFITKNEARSLGWEGGSVQEYAPGKAIGGDRYGNYEGNLPSKSGRTYYECDIDTDGKSSRGAKRIVYSNDGLIYYTSDHYETFTQLY